MAERTAPRAGAVRAGAGRGISTGWGAHQSGLMNYAGRDVDMYQIQHRRHRPLPRLQPRLRHALWDNLSHTRFGDLREPAHVPALAISTTSTGPAAGASPEPIARATAPPARSSPPALMVPLRWARPRTVPPSRRSTRPPQATNPQIHPQLPRGRGLRRLGRPDRERGGRGLRPPDLRERWPAPLD